MVLGLGTPEIIFIAVIAAIFFFGAPKVKEWADTFKNQKKAAVDIIKSDPTPQVEEEYIPVQKVKKAPVAAVKKKSVDEMEFP